MLDMAISIGCCALITDIHRDMNYNLLMDAFCLFWMNYGYLGVTKY